MFYCLGSSSVTPVVLSNRCTLVDLKRIGTQSPRSIRASGWVRTLKVTPSNSNVRNRSLPNGSRTTTVAWAVGDSLGKTSISSGRTPSCKSAEAFAIRRCVGAGVNSQVYPSPFTSQCAPPRRFATDRRRNSSAGSQQNQR